MKLPIDSKQLADVRTLLETSFESQLPAESTLRQALSDPLLSTLLSGNAPALGRMFTENSIRALRVVSGRFAISTGIPENVVGAFVKSISNAAAAQGADKWVAIAEGTSTAIIDTALEAAGEIPVIGWAAQLALGIARLAQALSKKKAPPPPMLQYTKETDELVAREALSIVGSLSSTDEVDWTPLFLPQTADSWRFRWTSDDGIEALGMRETGGFGCIPPGMFGSRVVQIQRASHGLERFSKAQSMDEWYLNNVGDAFDQFPSLARIAQAAWSAAGSNYTAAVFNMRYLEIRDAWQDYVEAGLALAENYIREGKKKPPPQVRYHAPMPPWTRYVSWRKRNAYDLWMPGASLKHQMNYANFVNGKLVRTGRGDSGPRTAAAIAKQWCDLYYDRAMAMLLTPVCAYASKRQAFFQNHLGAKERLEEGRRLLLQHPIVRSIDPKDVPDRNFRFAVQEAGGGTGDPDALNRIVRLGSAPVPQRTPSPPPPGASSGGGAMAVVLGVGALAAGGYFMARRR